MTDLASNPKSLQEQFHDMLHRDHTGLAAGLNAVLGVVGGFQWARESRGLYEWDDDRFHAEMGNMLDAVKKAADEALDRWKRGPLPCCTLERSAGETSDDWRPIETAPRDVPALFRIVSKDPDECYLDTDGRPITNCATPRIELTHYGRWSSLSKATHWMPAPTFPLKTNCDDATGEPK